MAQILFEIGQITSTINTVKLIVCVFFPIEQWPWHNNVVIDRSLTLFEDCAAGCVGKKSVPYFPRGTVKCTPLAPYQIHRQTGRQLKSKK